MLKKSLFISACLLLNQAYAQQHTAKELSGRWRTHIGGQTDDLLFISDAKGAVITPDNRLCAYFNYRTENRGKFIRLEFSFDVERAKHPNFQQAEIIFLNDTSFVCHSIFGNKFMNYLTKNDRTYTKVKVETQEKDLRPVAYKDLKGRWIGDHNNFDDPDTKDKKDMKLFIVDNSHVVEMHGDSAYNGTYKVDLAKQPSPMEFTYESGRVVQAFLMFIGTDKMRIQWFPNNNREDHFNDIGNTMWLLRQSAFKR